MKKILFAVLITLIVLANYGTASAQSKGAGREGGKTERVRERRKAQQADANEPRGQVEAAQAQEERERERRERRRQELMRLRKVRLQERERARLAGDVNRPEAEPGKGKEHQQQLAAMRAKIERERAKHLERTAKLERIRELAVAEESSETIARVDKLMQKERQRYTRKHRRMEMQMRTLMRTTGRKPGAPAPDEKRLKQQKRREALERGAYLRKPKGREGTGKEGGAEEAEQ
jgi:hypothetical protein